MIFLACAECATAALEAADGEAAVCHICEQPASAVAAWVIRDIPCIARLCDECHGTGLVPLVPN